jgi:hypothetical protein
MPERFRNAGKRPEEIEVKMFDGGNVIPLDDPGPEDRWIGGANVQMARELLHEGSAPAGRACSPIWTEPYGRREGSGLYRMKKSLAVWGQNRYGNLFPINGNRTFEHTHNHSLTNWMSYLTETRVQFPSFAPSFRPNDLL